MDPVDDLTYSIKVVGLAINVLIALEIAFFELARAWRQRPRQAALKRRSVQSNALSVGLFFFFLFSALGFLCHAFELRYAYFHPGADMTRAESGRLLADLKVVMFLYAVTAFFLLIERRLIKIPPKYLIVAALFIPLLLLAPSWLFTNLVYAFFPLAVVIFLVFLNLVVHTRGAVRRQFYAILVGFVLFLGAYAAMMHVFDPLVVLTEHVVSEPLMLAALVFLAYGLLSVSSLDEVFWPYFVEELHVLDQKDGRVLLSHDFTRDEHSALGETTLLSGIVGIDALLGEISASGQHLKTVDHEDRVLVIERGLRLTGVLVVKRHLHVYHSLLVNFLWELENEHLLAFLMNKALPADVDRAVQVHVRETFQPEMLALSPIKAGARSTRWHQIFRNTPTRRLRLKALPVHLAMGILQAAWIAWEVIQAGDLASLTTALAGSLVYQGVFVLLFLLHARLIRVTRRDFTQIARNFAPPAGSTPGPTIFRPRGYLLLYPVVALIFLLVASVEYLLQVSSLGAFVIFVVRFALLDGFLVCELFMVAQQFLRSRLLLVDVSHKPE